MIFDQAFDYSVLETPDSELKQFLNYNPQLSSYTRKQNFPGRSPDETDRGGWRGYSYVYSKYFKDKRNDPIFLLEIGIHYGYGLLAWARYFSNATVFGIDNVWDKTRSGHFAKLQEKFPQLQEARTYIFDTTQSVEWSIVKPNFSVIIDDGGHNPITQLETFDNAWPKLKAGGLYFIEDIGHRYGEDKLLLLSNRLKDVRRDGNLVEIYSHQNLGLKHIMSNSGLRKQYGVNCPDGTSCTEYIVCIQKLG